MRNLKKLMGDTKKKKKFKYLIFRFWGYFWHEGDLVCAINYIFKINYVTFKLIVNGQVLVQGNNIIGGFTKKKMYRMIMESIIYKALSPGCIQITLQ